MPAVPKEHFALLGLPPLEALADEVVRRAALAGITARQLAKSRQDVPLWAWEQACQEAHRTKRVAQEWAPCKDHPVMAQESRYVLPVAAP